MKRRCFEALLINGKRIIFGEAGNFKKILCWIIGHKWELQYAPRFFYEPNDYKIEVHDIICQRCKEEVRDCAISPI